MTLEFRNVQASSDDPVETWPHEALLTALERGGLAIRSRIAAEIRDYPWGAVARGVEQILTYSRPYGVAELFEEVIAQARDSVVHDERNEVRRRVRAAIDSAGLTMEHFAASVGTSRSRLSTYASGKVTPSAGMLLRIERAGHSADSSHLS